MPFRCYSFCYLWSYFLVLSSCSLLSRHIGTLVVTNTWGVRLSQLFPLVIPACIAFTPNIHMAYSITFSVFTQLSSSHEALTLIATTWGSHAPCEIGLLHSYLSLSKVRFLKAYPSDSVYQDHLDACENASFSGSKLRPINCNRKWGGAGNVHFNKSPRWKLSKLRFGNYCLRVL